MKKKMLPVGLLFAGLLLSVNANMVLAQTSTASDPATSNPQLKVSPMKALQNFEPAENEEYALGPGDEISLDFPAGRSWAARKLLVPMAVSRCRWLALLTSRTRTGTRSLNWW